MRPPQWFVSLSPCPGNPSYHGRLAPLRRVLQSHTSFARETATGLMVNRHLFDLRPMVHPETGDRAGMPLRAYWSTQQNHISSFCRPSVDHTVRTWDARAVALAKNLSMGPHWGWDRVGRSWSVEVTMVHAVIRYGIETGCVVECARRIDDCITHVDFVYAENRRET